MNWTHLIYVKSSKLTTRTQQIVPFWQTDLAWIRRNRLGLNRTVADSYFRTRIVQLQLSGILFKFVCVWGRRIIDMEWSMWSAAASAGGGVRLNIHNRERLLRLRGGGGWGGDGDGDGDGGRRGEGEARSFATHRSSHHRHHHYRQRRTWPQKPCPWNRSLWMEDHNEEAFHLKNARERTVKSPSLPPSVSLSLSLILLGRVWNM